MATHFLCDKGVRNHTWYFKSGRRLASCVLLSVFLPMLLCVSLHVHLEAGNYADECYDCIHQLPHPAHFSVAYCTSHYDCLLCHLLQVPYIPAYTVTYIIYRDNATLRSVRLMPRVAAGTWSVRQSRAPPVLIIPPLTPNIRNFNQK